MVPADVPDELYERLRERFSPEQLVELAGLVAAENFIARFNRIFDVGSQGFLVDPPADGG